MPWARQRRRDCRPADVQPQPPARPLRICAEAGGPPIATRAIGRPLNRACADAAAILVVSAPPDVQKARVLARGQMTEAEFEAILARQVPDSVKRGRADFVIDTSQGFAHAEQRVDEILAQLRTGAADGQDKTG